MLNLAEELRNVSKACNGGPRDTFIGNAGNDLLHGGSGADIYRYTLLNQSTPAAGGRDSIADFKTGIDFIDLSAIDAVNNGSSVNDFFTFIGEKAFSAPGQVRYVSATGVLQANVGGMNGNVADFQIQLVGAPVFAATDLIA